jgi:hypothetical protein
MLVWSTVAAVLAGLVFCRYKAIRYNDLFPLLEAQMLEREAAPRIVECLSRNFELLANGKDVITPDLAHRIRSLPLDDDDKFLLWQAVRLISGEWVADQNPWVLAPHRYYQRTPIGHIIGLHTETRSAGASSLFSAGTTIDVAIEDWGVSRPDLSTYVKRVNARQKVSTALRVNRA